VGDDDGEGELGDAFVQIFGERQQFGEPAGCGGEADGGEQGGGDPGVKRIARFCAAGNAVPPQPRGVHRVGQRQRRFFARHESEQQSHRDGAQHHGAGKQVHGVQVVGDVGDDEAAGKDGVPNFKKLGLKAI